METLSPLAGPPDAPPRNALTTEPAPPRSRLPRTLTSLENYDFRWLMASSAAGQTANWVEIIVRSLMVYELTGSAIILGLVMGARTLPMLFIGLIGGVLADRYDRKWLLGVSQAANGVIAVGLGVLTAMQAVDVWHFALASLLGGVAGAVQQPARQAMLPTLVPREHLVNAVALQSSSFQLSRLLGPGIAGGVAAVAGLGAALFVEAILYFIGMACILRTHTPPAIASGAIPVGPDARGRDRRGRDAGGMRGFLASFKGYGYLRENDIVGWLVVLALVPVFFGLSNQVLAPVFAKEVLHMGAGGVGMLLSAPSFGAVAATLMIATAGDVRRKGWLVLIGVVGFGVATLVYASSTVLWLSLAALVFHGFFHTGYRAFNQTLLQLHTPDEYRGRVMAVLATDRGLHPLSTMAVAFLTDLFSPSLAVAATGVGCLLCALLVGALSRTLRELD